MKKPVILDLPLSFQRFGGVIGTRLVRMPGDRIILQIAFTEVNGVERVRFTELLLPVHLIWREGISLAAFNVRTCQQAVQLVLEISGGSG